MLAAPLAPAVVADVPDVQALYDRYDEVEFGRGQMDPGDVEEQLTVPRTEAVVLRDGDRLLGYAHLAADGEGESVVDPAAPARRALQDALVAWVLDRAAGRGLGRVGHWGGTSTGGLAAPVRALLLEALGRDRAVGRTRTTLTVDGENDRPRALYDRVGMTVLEEYRRWERAVA